MATIVTIHGTYAHGSGEPTPSDAESWWRPGSGFAREIANKLEGVGPGETRQPVAVEAFEWSGENSEVARRRAAEALLTRLGSLDAKGETYAIVAHSHGGSVVANALLAAAARQRPLAGLQRWITVGTPFVEMRRQRLLFERLSLIEKVVLVASLMLLVMFATFLVAQLLAGVERIQVLLEQRTLLTALLMSVPAIIITAILTFIDRRRVFFYRRSTIERARSQFGPRWTALWHGSDEAIQGLRSVGQAKVELFSSGFATARLTLVAVIALPLAYLIAVSSPSAMLSLADFLKNSVYEVDKLTARAEAYARDRGRVRDMAVAMREQSQRQADGQQQAGWSRVREQRRQLTEKYPDYRQLARALRFKCEFLMEPVRPGAGDGRDWGCNPERRRPCADGRLCGGGRDRVINSELMLHIAMDNVTSSVINDDTRFGNWTTLVHAILPMLIVPVVSILVALLLTLIVRALAGLVSALLARVLNRVTVSEAKQAIYGNDTEGETAFGAGPRPPWIEAGAPALPADVSARITERANAATEASLAKFRNALSEIALAEGPPHQASIVSNYFTWKELVHTSYFDEPAVRAMIARDLAESGRFAASEAFTADPLHAQAGAWLASIRQAPRAQAEAAAS